MVKFKNISYKEIVGLNSIYTLVETDEKDENILTKIIPTHIHFYDQNGIIISYHNVFREQLPDFEINGISMNAEKTVDYKRSVPYLMKKNEEDKGFVLMFPVGDDGYRDEQWNLVDDEDQLPYVEQSLYILGLEVVVSERYEIPAVSKLKQVIRQYRSMVRNLSTNPADFKVTTEKNLKKIEEKYLEYAEINNSLLTYSIESFCKEYPDMGVGCRKKIEDLGFLI